jgi:mevalonate kinase
MPKHLRIKSPGKIIISGEHAVVHGAPALAMAINRFVTVEITEQSSFNITIDLVDLGYRKTFKLLELEKLKQQIFLRYKDYLEGNLEITKVLQSPSELLLYTCAYCIEYVLEHSNNFSGLAIKINSDIPIGYGMGSSAATIIALWYAFVNFFDLEFAPQDYLDFGRSIENFQHGRSSGLDLYLALNGGCILFERDLNRTTIRSLPQIPFAFIDTGKPQTSTGECVNHAAQVFKNDTTLANKFASITLALDKAVQTGDLAGTKFYIRENNKLLENIGVVPKKVQNFIECLEQQDLAAKISGAGACAGDNAGIVLICGHKNGTSLEDIICDYSYNMLNIKGEIYGARTTS